MWEQHAVLFFKQQSAVISSWWLMANFQEHCHQQLQAKLLMGKQNSSKSTDSTVPFSDISFVLSVGDWGQQ